MTPQPPTQPANYLDQSSGDYLRAQLQAMQNGVYATMVAPDHTKAWDSDQLALQKKINGIAAQVNSGVDPETLTGSDEFATLTLEQMRDLSNEIKPDVVQAVSEAWDKIGKTLGDATTALSDGLKKTVGTGWQGQAAGSAADAIGQLTQTSSDNAQSAQMVGMKVAFAQRGSDETLRTLGPVLAAAAPSGPLPTVLGSNGKPLSMGGPEIPGATSPIPILAATQSEASQKEEARQACLQVLNNVYAPGMHGGDQGVPVLPSVHQIANPVGPITPGPTTPGPTAPVPGGSGPGGTQNSGSGTSGTQPGNQQPGQGNGQQQPTSPSDSGGSNTDAAGYSPGQSGPSSLGASSPTSTAGVGSNIGSGGGSSIPGLGGSSIPGGGGGLGGGGLDEGTSRPGGPGASVPGKPSPTSVPAAAAGRVVPGASGTSPGMMGQGARGAGEKKDDGEHKSSDLLRGQHLEEWIADGERVLPAFGVIGERPPAPSTEQPPSAPPGRGGVSGEYR